MQHPPFDGPIPVPPRYVTGAVKRRGGSALVAFASCRISYGSFVSGGVGHRRIGAPPPPEIPPVNAIRREAGAMHHRGAAILEPFGVTMGQQLIEVEVLFGGRLFARSWVICRRRTPRSVTEIAIIRSLPQTEPPARTVQPAPARPPPLPRPLRCPPASQALPAPRMPTRSRSCA
jgi:hypothetical protein